MNRDDQQIAGWRKWRFGFGAGEEKPIERDEPEQPEGMHMQARILRLWMLGGGG